MFGDLIGDCPSGAHFTGREACCLAVRSPPAIKIWGMLVLGHNDIWGVIR